MQDIYEIRRTNALLILNTRFGGQKTRLARAIDDLPESAGRSPLQPSYLSRALLRDAADPKNIGPELARKIEKAGGLPANWLDQDHSTDQSLSDDDVANSLPSVGRSAARSNDELHALGLKPLPVAIGDAFISVPQLTVRPAAGGSGYEVGTIEVVDDSGYAYKKSYLARRGIDPARAAVMIVEGVSMEPLILHGDAVLVRLTERCDYVSDAVYVFLVQNELRIKKCRWRTNGDLELISENDRYPIEVVPREMLPNVACIGQAMNRAGDL